MIDASSIKHIAFIMDGNGRWAKQRHMPREYGHKVGAEAFERIVNYCYDIGIGAVTVYAFSTENWKRPQPEVSTLMGLISEFAVSELPNMMKDGVRLRTIGRTNDLPFAARTALLRTIDLTAKNDKLILTVALSYGGRAEIVDAVNRIIAEKRTAPVTEQDFTSYLYAPDIPDPDLLIRTGGEKRLSNFLLWELSYAELYVTDTYWPDFDENALRKALDSFGGRKRRFGGLNSQNQ